MLKKEDVEAADTCSITPSRARHHLEVQLVAECVDGWLRYHNAQCGVLGGSCDCVSPKTVVSWTRWEMLWLSGTEVGGLCRQIALPQSSTQPAGPAYSTLGTS